MLDPETIAGLRTQIAESVAGDRGLLGERVARVRRAGEGVGIFVVGVGLEFFEIDVERPDDALEGISRRQIGE